MRSPALAIGWDLWRQHRPWLVPVVAWVVVIDTVLYNAAPAGSLALADPFLVAVTEGDDGVLEPLSLREKIRVSGLTFDAIAAEAVRYA